MSILFKENPKEFKQRKLFAQNVFDLLSPDYNCSIYKDIFSQIDTKALEEKYSMLAQHAYHIKLIVLILIYTCSHRIYSLRKIEQKCKHNLVFMCISHFKLSYRGELEPVTT